MMLYEQRDKIYVDKLSFIFYVPSDRTAGDKVLYLAFWGSVRNFSKFPKEFPTILHHHQQYTIFSTQICPLDHSNHSL